jgi:hypothetical protein
MAGAFLVVYAVCQPAERLPAVLYPLFILGEVILALSFSLLVTMGAALGRGLQPGEGRHWHRPLPGKDLLTLVACLTTFVVYALCKCWREASGLGDRVILGALAAALLITLAFSVKTAKATWGIPSGRMWLVVPMTLLLWLLCFLGVATMKLGEKKYCERPSFAFEYVRAGPSDRVAMLASMTKLIDISSRNPEAKSGCSALLVSDRNGHRIAEVAGDSNQSPYAEWSFDGRFLYLCRREPAERNIGRLWRYSLSDHLIVPLRRIPLSPLRVSPDGRRVIFRRQMERQAGWVNDLVCGSLEEDSSDIIICEHGPRAWPWSCCWGPRSGNVYFPTYEESALGEQWGLWSVHCSDRGAGHPVLLVSRVTVTEMACNPTETRVVILLRDLTAKPTRQVLRIVDLQTLTSKEVVLHEPFFPPLFEDWLIWDTKGLTLVFADAEGLKAYDARTKTVHLVVGASRRAEAFPGYEPLTPLGWFSTGELLYRNEFVPRLYEWHPQSGEIASSPLNRRIPRWLKQHKTLVPFD